MFLTTTLQVRLKALWFAASIISSLWFLYWILYDVLVWNKALTQANPANYGGLILSITLIILGKQLGKFGFFKKTKFLVEQSVPIKSTEKIQVQQVQQVLEGEQIQPIKQVQQIQPVKEEEKQIPQDSVVPPGCRFYLGYLHKRTKSSEIPQECLECENNVNCLSPQLAV